MARIRIWDPDGIYHICNRTQEAKFLLAPDDEFNDLVHLWLERAVRIFEVELYAAVVMGNHYHLVARAPLMNMSKFLQYFQGNLARAVNKLRKRYDAAVFPRRFAAEPILDEPSLERMLAYVLGNPVAANLVERPEEYPGLTTYRQSTGQGEKRLTLSVPPAWRGLNEHELVAKFQSIVRRTVSECAKKRGRPVLGAAVVRSTDWWRRPRRPKRSRRAFCHGASKQVRRRYSIHANSTETRYRAAVLAWREGRAEPFPFGTIPPGWTTCFVEGRDRRMPRELRLAA